MCFRCVLDGKAGYASTENCTENAAGGSAAHALGPGHVLSHHIDIHQYLRAFADKAGSPNRFIDKLNGRRMGMAPTGNSRRQSYQFEPTSRMTNTYIAAGEDEDRDIIASIGYGLYAKSMGHGACLQRMPAGLVENHASESVLNGYRHGARFDITRVQHGDCLAG